MRIPCLQKLCLGSVALKSWLKDTKFPRRVSVHRIDWFVISIATNKDKAWRKVHPAHWLLTRFSQVRTGGTRALRRHPTPLVSALGVIRAPRVSQPARCSPLSAQKRLSRVAFAMKRLCWSHSDCITISAWLGTSSVR